MKKLTFDEWFDYFLKVSPLAQVIKDLLTENDEISFAVFHTIKGAWIASEENN